jgi:hypothetical protein
MRDPRAVAGKGRLVTDSIAGLLGLPSAVTSNIRPSRSVASQPVTVATLMLPRDRPRGGLKVATISRSGIVR